MRGQSLSKTKTGAAFWATPVQGSRVVKNWDQATCASSPSSASRST
jgi:hypothetical protein